MNHKQQRQLPEAEKRRLNREYIEKTKPKHEPSSQLKRRRTRRGKKKKPAWVQQRKKERNEAMEQYKKQRKERWEQYQEFLRKIHD